MKRKLITLLLSALVACVLIVMPVLAYSPFPMDADAPEIQGALGYLSGEQAADGSIGSYGDSAWVIMSIAAAGEDAREFGDPSVVDYVKDNADFSGEFNLGTTYARMILAAVAANEDPSAFGPGDGTYVTDGNYLSALKALYTEQEPPPGFEGEYYGQFEDGFGDLDTMNDDYWGLMALIAAGESQDSPMVQGVAAFIEANQAFDGGWSWATPDNPWYWGSDTDDTAAALMALTAAGGASAPTIVDNALMYIKYNQGPNGGFLYDPSGTENLASTVWAVDALVAVGEDPTAPEWTTGANPIDFVMTYNKEDGSFLDENAWSPNPYKDTADAIVTLLGKYYPIEAPYLGYTFEDPWRGTAVTINEETGTFRFTAPDGYDSGKVEAARMRVRHGRITIWHNDDDIRFVCRANLNRDFCFGLLLDKETWTRYLIYDPWGVE